MQKRRLDAKLTAEVTFAQTRIQTSIMISSGPLVINNTVSSLVFNETGVRSDIECIDWCQMRSCYVAIMKSATGVCQLIVLDNGGGGLSDSYVQRSVGADDGDRVWKVPDLHVNVESCTSGIRVFNNTGNGNSGTIQSLKINVTCCYRIEATGARGGSIFNGPTVYAGGNGSRMSGKFSLTAGTNLTIVVGQRGGDESQGTTNAGSGGGGGTFVYTTADSVLLLAAGGGGGGGSEAGNGLPGQSGTNGTNSLPVGIRQGFGGANGQPGVTNNAMKHGGPGAGWLGKAASARQSINSGERGGSRADGWIGGVPGDSNPGAVGGFGGGGGGARSTGASGGGGGFSGGGSGFDESQAGGGGGSFCGGVGCTGVTGGNTDLAHGSVVFQPAPDGCN